VIKPGHILVKFDRVIATDWPMIPNSKRGGSAMPCGVKEPARLVRRVRKRFRIAGNFHTPRLPTWWHDGT